MPRNWDLWLRMGDVGARFTTVADRTAVLLDDIGARRHRVRPAHRMPLALFDEPRDARAALRELTDRRHDEEFRAAHLADTSEWLNRLAASPEFVRPLGSPGDPLAALTAAMTSGVPLRSGLVVCREGSRFALAQPLLCGTAEHARRIGESMRATQRRTLALIAEVAAGVAARTCSGGPR